MAVLHLWQNGQVGGIRIRDIEGRVEQPYNADEQADVVLSLLNMLPSTAFRALASKLGLEENYLVKSALGGETRIRERMR